MKQGIRGGTVGQLETAEADLGAAPRPSDRSTGYDGEHLGSQADPEERDLALETVGDEFTNPGQPGCSFVVRRPGRSAEYDDTIEAVGTTGDRGPGIRADPNQVDASREDSLPDQPHTSISLVFDH